MYKIEKYAEKKKKIDEDDENDDGSDAEIKRSKKYNKHTLAMMEKVDGKQLLKDYFEAMLQKGIEVEFNSDDEIEQKLGDEGEVLTEEIKKHDVWLDQKQRKIMNTIGLYMIKQIVKQLTKPEKDALDQSKIKRANIALKNTDAGTNDTEAKKLEAIRMGIEQLRQLKEKADKERHAE